MAGNAVKKRAEIYRRGANRRREARETEEETSSKVSFLRDAAGLFFVVLSLFLSAALYSYFFNSQYSPLFINDTVREVHPNLMGRVGELVAQILAKFLGWCSFFLVVWSILLAFRLWRGEQTEGWGSILSLVSAAIGSVLLVASAASFSAVIAGYEGGGLIGSSIAFRLIELVNEPGALLISVAVFLLSLGVASGLGTVALVSQTKKIAAIFPHKKEEDDEERKSFAERFDDARYYLLTAWDYFVDALSLIYRFLSSVAQLIWSGFQRLFGFFRKDEYEAEDEYEEETVERPRSKRKKRDELDEPEFVTEEKRRKAKIRVLRRKHDESGKKRAKIPRIESEQDSTYTAPSIELLSLGEKTVVSGPDDKELIDNSRKLEKTLADFKVGGKVTEVQPGPVITLYHFEPAAGIKVQRVIGLADDLALALKVASVRVYAPVPGKGTVGIEVPNSVREVVLLRHILASEEFNTAPSRAITLGFGKDTFGSPYVADLSRMPHLLIAGATGTGKSVGLNSMLLSLLYRNSPDDLQLILIDPKMLELSLYEGIPHLRAPVVTNPKKARGVLHWAVEEMERRYQLMMDLGVRNLAGFNKEIKRKIAKLETDTEIEAEARKSDKIPLETLPRIVIVVDELADLMLSVGREVEELITRLAQKARASGIHLILATQRPSVNVITGLIKANFPARLSFKVATRIDSRTVLDASGSERLLGEGDMLFLSPITGRIIRLHGAFVSDEEVQAVVEYLKDQGTPRYDDEIEATIERLNQAEKSGTGLNLDEEFDPLYDDAVRLVTEKGVASTSMVQRAFRIGYNRAARILEMMEREGVVGPADGAKPRQVFAGNLTS